MIDFQCLRSPWKCPKLSAHATGKVVEARRREVAWPGLCRHTWQSPYSILSHAMVSKISCEIFCQCDAILSGPMSRWGAVSLWCQGWGRDMRLMQTSDITSSSNIFEIVRCQAWPLAAQSGSGLENDYSLKMIKVFSVLWGLGGQESKLYTR